MSATTMEEGIKLSAELSFTPSTAASGSGAVAFFEGSVAFFEGSGWGEGSGAFCNTAVAAAFFGSGTGPVMAVMVVSLFTVARVMFAGNVSLNFVGVNTTVSVEADETVKSTIREPTAMLVTVMRDALIFPRAMAMSFLNATLNADLAVGLSIRLCARVALMSSVSFAWITVGEGGGGGSDLGSGAGSGSGSSIHDPAIELEPCAKEPGTRARHITATAAANLAIVASRYVQARFFLAFLPFLVREYHRRGAR